MDKEVCLHDERRFADPTERRLMRRPSLIDVEALNRFFDTAPKISEVMDRAYRLARAIIAFYQFRYVITGDEKATSSALGSICFTLSREVFMLEFDRSFDSTTDGIMRDMTFEAGTEEMQVGLIPDKDVILAKVKSLGARKEFVLTVIAQIKEAFRTHEFVRSQAEFFINDTEMWYGQVTKWIVKYAVERDALLNEAVSALLNLYGDRVGHTEEILENIAHWNDPTTDQMEPVDLVSSLFVKGDLEKFVLYVRMFVPRVQAVIAECDKLLEYAQKPDAERVGQSILATSQMIDADLTLPEKARAMSFRLKYVRDIVAHVKQYNIRYIKEKYGDVLKELEDSLSAHLRSLQPLTLQTTSAL